MKLQEFEPLTLQMHALHNPIARANQGSAEGYYRVYDKAGRWIVGLTANK